MRILGIETSCDETAAAVVEYSKGLSIGAKVLSSVISTSADMHIATGGIIPESAARRQVEVMMPVIQKALADANLGSNIYEPGSSIDAIAVTTGPGLIGSLLVGVETAKTLARVWNKPIIPINHLVAHIYANWLMPEQESEKDIRWKSPEFPALALVVSGGHTDLVLIKKHGDIRWIGGTRDDAAGECFDKCARLLNLPYPGGPSISAAADKWKMENCKWEMNLFPRPMMHSNDYDFSFSGLKTAVLNYLKDNSNYNVDYLAAEIQEAIVDVLIKKSIDAINKFKPKSFLLSGGVAANNRLREKLSLEIRNYKLEIDLRIPEVHYCTDNAVSIATAAHYLGKAVPLQKLLANPELEIVARIT